MSFRRESIEGLYSGDGIIPFSKQEGSQAQKALERSRATYEGRRREALPYQLARWYRVAIFGSARLDEHSEEFQFVTDLTKALVQARDIDIVTGGGPGIMKAALMGAQLAVQEAAIQGKRIKSRTHGITISLPKQEEPNEHIERVADHPEFSTRLQDFVDKTRAAYYAPGGIGTLLEMLMVVQETQVSHLEPEYIIIAHPFCECMVDTWNNEMYHKRVANGRTPLISEDNLQIITFSDNISDIVGAIAVGYDSWQEQVRSR